MESREAVLYVWHDTVEVGLSHREGFVLHGFDRTSAHETKFLSRLIFSSYIANIQKMDGMLFVRRSGRTFVPCYSFLLGPGKISPNEIET